MTPPDLDALSPPDRILLRLIALIGPLPPARALLDCLNQARVSPTLWTHEALVEAQNSLRRHGLLNNKMACPPALAHAVAIAALETAEGKALAIAIRTQLPAESKSYWDPKLVEVDFARGLRLAALQNDGAEVQRLLGLVRRPAHALPELFNRHFTPVPLGIDWLAGRAPVIQATLLAAKLGHWMATAEMSSDLPALVDHAQAHQILRRDCFSLIADFRLLSGQLPALQALLADAPTPEAALPYAAAHALLSEDAPRARALFGEAVTQHRRALRKRKGGLPGHLGVLHLCAQLAGGDPGQHAAIPALAQDMVQAGQIPLGSMAIEALASLAANKPEAALNSVKWLLTATDTMARPSPLGLGLVAVAAAVVDAALARQHADAWDQWFRHLAPTMPLAADLMAEVLDRVANDPTPYQTHLARPDRRVTLRFLTLLPVKEPWERALESLEVLLEPPAPVERKTTGKRLAWLVDPSSGAVEPVEQVQQRGPTKSPTQGWSVGRPIPLKRLYQGDAQLTYLDEFDRRVIATIARDYDGWGHGRSRYDYFLPPRDTLPALVGHPRVFYRREPGPPVELVLARPELVLAGTRGGYRLALSHPAEEVDAIIDVEGPTRWRVVVIDDKAVAAGKLLGADGITVPAMARDRLAAIARSRMPDLPVRVEAADLDEGRTEAGDPAPVVRLRLLDPGLKVSLGVRPLGPDGPHFAPGQGSRRVTGNGRRALRDLAAEERLAQALADACPSLGGEGLEWDLEGLSAALEFLSELKALPEPPTLEWPEGQKLTLRGEEAGASHFSTTVKSTESWFAVAGALKLDEGLVLDLKDLLIRLEDAPGRFVPLGDGQFVALDRHFRQQLDRLMRLGGQKVPRAAGAALRGLVEEAASAQVDQAWHAFIQNLDDAAAWQPRLPNGLTAELREYQAEGYFWMSRLARLGAGALLADDMGLGKTVQAIALMAAKAGDGPMLVVAPTSVAGNWQSELARFAPGLTVHRLAETGGRQEVLRALGPGDVLVTTYGLLVREEVLLAAVPWAVAVLDEAQAIKNPDTHRAQAARALTAGFRLALTGTPVENDLEELWSLFQFTNPGLLGSRKAFAQRFGTPIQAARSPGARAALRAVVQPFLLRRTKGAVLAELPPRTEQTLLVERGADEIAFYEALRRRALEKLEEMSGERSRIHILAEITRLRQACCHPDLVAADAHLPSAKLDAFLELVDELREGGHRVLVFSQFIGHLARVRTALDRMGVTYQLLDGSLTAAERQRRVAAFQAGEGDLFLISLKAGGVGLNLTAADYVIHLDPWWNPAVEDQASDRAHRIGQRRPVTIYRLILKGSIEEGIVALHGRKRDLADALLQDADTAGYLSDEDLLALIRGVG
ncbi:DEAD/DEAH box helicase [Nitrospirillum sp. BR 11163]|uniref:DEAD/DEAH box helicase n=1 Tax=Nitrospirillum sp. BR 11163 TaxID=3104323 RepID=UPI002AFE56FF|nr:DEAD/DEAH box helicase [Nitrospirillum sp. BR 11163]MEA1674324.1 DEAD/DEAH box helicase [Nitrospirillum sp. BR 11163]